MNSIDEIQPLKLDNLGPIIINTDGSTSRIPNFHTFTEDEKAHAFKLISKRNEARRLVLIEQRRVNGSEIAESVTADNETIETRNDTGELLALEDSK